MPFKDRRETERYSSLYLTIYIGLFVTSFSTNFRYKIKDMQIGTKTKLGYGLTCQV